MTILDKIIAYKKKEVADRKKKSPIKLLEKSEFFSFPVFSLKKHLLNDDIGIIAEYKRKSPSKGIINDKSSVEKVTAGYVSAGASALSILTDTEFFGGTADDITSVRKQIKLPILRKDFIIDEYQIIEAKSIGADVILLLANVLTAQQIKEFATTAKWLGMEVLLEVRDKSELNTINVLIDCIGVNNRNLKDFSVNANQSLELIDFIPKDFIKISESGIDSAITIHDLRSAGFKGFLIGETFMKNDSPEIACANFIKEVREYKS